MPDCILAIAGSDSSGGAGIQADSRTIQALGRYAVTAVTAVTAQGSEGVTACLPIRHRLIAEQMRVVLADFEVAAVKIGLLPGAKAIRAVSRELQQHVRTPLVLDPVIASSSGTRFLSDDDLLALKRHFRGLPTVVTPNRPEAELLAGMPVRTDAAAEKAGLRLMELFRCSILIKGGHATGTCRDCLVLPSRDIRWFESPRIKTRNLHGTGCVLSSAIAVHLGRGERLDTAIDKARTFLWRKLEAGRKTDWGIAVGPAFS